MWIQSFVSGDDRRLAGVIVGRARARREEQSEVVGDVLRPAHVLGSVAARDSFTVTVNGTLHVGDERVPSQWLRSAVIKK